MNVTEVAAPTHAKSMLCPAASHNELFIVIDTAPDDVLITMSFATSEIVGVSDDVVTERIG